MKEKNKLLNDHNIGALSAFGAYAMWGMLPIYWKFLGHVPSLEVLAHRIVWSFVFVVTLLITTGTIGGFFTELYTIISQKLKLLAITAASIIITLNWYTYIWAVANSHIVETSLGYYINPLVSVILGIVFLKERLSPWQIVSFVIATIGVLNMVFHFGAVPWIALTLAVTFAVYGLLKKVANVGAISGIALETFIISPIALSYIIFLHAHGHGSIFAISPMTTGLLVGSGVITAIPLILFANGANRLPLYMVGFLQYISPTLMLIIGVFLYHEPFSAVHLTSFALIWIALAIFSLAKTPLFLHYENILLGKRKKKTS
ncbi:MAG TPA: EamA family transporter RarD [Clostridia bacterium]|nr:EamA family transporter RarD [Clostridia bacterium]